MPTVNRTDARFRGRHISPNTSRKTRKGKIQLEVIRYDYCCGNGSEPDSDGQRSCTGRVTATHPILRGLVRLADDYVELWLVSVYSVFGSVLVGGLSGVLRINSGTDICTARPGICSTIRSEFRYN
jgi:hypothetical protein